MGAFLHAVNRPGGYGPDESCVKKAGGMRKNVASQVIAAQMVSASDGSAFTGSVTVYTTIDGGTQDGGVAATHEGNGCHTYAPSQALTNGDHIAYTFTGSGAIPVTVNVYPVSFDYTDPVRIGITALPNAAADAAGGLPISDAGGLDVDTLDSNVSAILTDTAEIGAAGAGLTTLATAAALATVDSNVDAILVDTGTTLDAKIDTIDGIVDSILVDTGTTLDGKIDTIDTNVDAILVDTNELQTDWTDAGRLDTIVDSILTDTGTTLDGKIDTIDGIVDDILVDTAEIGAAGAGLTDLATAAALTTVDTVVDAIKAKTDSLTFTVANEVDANAVSVAGDSAAATQLAAHAKTAVAVTFSAGGTTTTAVLNQVDGAAASSTNDVYNGRVLIFTAPAALEYQVTDITDYVGSTKTATITAVTTGPGATATAIMV